MDIHGLYPSRRVLRQGSDIDGGARDLGEATTGRGHIEHLRGPANVTGALAFGFAAQAAFQITAADGGLPFAQTTFVIAGGGSREIRPRFDQRITCYS
jgi:hypothetical protein